MKILTTSKELTPQETYHLTMNPTTQRISDADTQIVEISAWIQYTDEDSKGKTQNLLAILTPDNEVFATNSKTFQKDFIKMNALFNGLGEEVHAIKVVSGQSNNDRTFYTCVYER